MSAARAIFLNCECSSLSNTSLGCKVAKADEPSSRDKSDPPWANCDLTLYNRERIAFGVPAAKTSTNSENFLVGPGPRGWPQESHLDSRSSPGSSASIACTSEMKDADCDEFQISFPVQYQ